MDFPYTRLIVVPKTEMPEMRQVMLKKEILYTQMIPLELKVIGYRGDIHLAF